MLSMCYAMCFILLCLFVTYLTTLSRAHIIRRRMEGCWWTKYCKYL